MRAIYEGDDAFVREIRASFAEALNVPVSTLEAVHHKPNSDVADSPTVMIIPGAAVLLLSPPDYPHVIASRVLKSRTMKDYLGSDLGEPVLAALLEGTIKGRSFAVHAWREPFSERKIVSWVQRRRIVRPLIGWLNETTAIDPIEAVGTRMETALNTIQGLAGAPRCLQEVADRGMQRLCSGRLQPRHSAMHGDLWAGNVLAAGRDAKRPFTLIDFGASRVSGFPFYDLIRAAQSLPMRSSEIRVAVLEQCRRMRCEVADAPVYLAAALGLVLESSEKLPLASFYSLAERCIRTMDESGLLRSDLE